MAVQEVTKNSFKDIIDNHKIVIVDFWAPWCGPCRSFAPIYEKVSEKDEYKDIVFSKVNTQDEQELAAGFQIRSIPTLMVFREQIVMFSQAGMVPESALEEIISKVQALDMDQVRKEIAEQNQT